MNKKDKIKTTEINYGNIHIKKKWAFQFVNNWGQGALIVLCFVCNRAAGIGFIFMNFGFYLFREIIEEQEKESEN